MRKPKLPKDNPNFWISIAKDSKQTEDFLQRGNERQRNNLTKALKYLKWIKIQGKRRKYETAIKYCIFVSFIIIDKLFK